MLSFPILSAILLANAQASTWTVDPAGGGDATTIEDGMALLAEGDTLSIAPGTYDVLEVWMGMSDVTIRGAGWGATVFDGSVAGTRSGATGLGLGGDNIVLEGVSFRNYESQYALVLGGNITVQSCAFIDNYQGVRAYDHMASALVFMDTIFAENEVGIYIPDEVESLHVENSIFVDDQKGVIQYSEGDYTNFGLVELVNNTFAGSTGAGLSMVGPGDSEDVASTLYIVNNVFSDMPYPWYLNLDNFPSVVGEIRNNIYSAITAENERYSNVTLTDNLEAEVDFVAWSDDGDWTNDDLHLMAGSPGIDAGADGYATLDYDADGVLRPVDGDGDGVAVIDAGAYEYCSEDACPRTDTGGDTGSASDTDSGSDTASDTASDTGGESDSAEDSDTPGDTGGAVITGGSAWSCTTAGGTGPGAGLILALASLLGLRRRQR